MAETVTNRGKYRALNALVGASDLRMLVIVGTQTGVNSADLSTVAELDAVSGVSIHSERVALSSETTTQDDANDRATLDSANVTFAAAASVTAQGVAVYDEGSGSDASRDLIAVYTTGFPQPMDGGLTITVSDLLRAT